MSIKNNYIANMEEYAGIMASAIDGDMKTVKSQALKGIHLTEGVLIGRHYKEMPIIAQRICGACSVAHNIASIKAVENAMKVEVSEETKKLRKKRRKKERNGSKLCFLKFVSSSSRDDDQYLSNNKHKAGVRGWLFVGPLDPGCTIWLTDVQ